MATKNQPPNDAPNRPDLTVAWEQAREMFADEREAIDHEFEAWNRDRPSPWDLGCKAPRCLCESPCDAYADPPEPPWLLDADRALSRRIRATAYRLAGLEDPLAKR